MTPSDLLDQAIAQARKCGLQEPLEAAAPQLHDYRTAYGFSVVVSEKKARGRMGTVWFTEKGKMTLWTLDGVPGL